MKPPMNESPMQIKGAATNPKHRENVGVKGQASMQKGGNMGSAMAIKNAVSKPKKK